MELESSKNCRKMRKVHYVEPKSEITSNNTVKNKNVPPKTKT
ncbi:4230_t:CDS:1, partial [Gigaspora rosea]